MDTTYEGVLGKRQETFQEIQHEVCNSVTALSLPETVTVECSAMLELRSSKDTDYLVKNAG